MLETVYKLDEHGEFYVVHTDDLFLVGFDNNYDPIWSKDIQDAAIWCDESANLLALEHNVLYSPITVLYSPITVLKLFGD